MNLEISSTSSESRGALDNPGHLHERPQYSREPDGEEVGLDSPYWSQQRTVDSSYLKEDLGSEEQSTQREEIGLDSQQWSRSGQIDSTYLHEED